MRQLAAVHGDAGWHAKSFPLSVDGAEIVASLVLLADRRAGRKSGWLPWAALIIGTAASLAANIATADQGIVSRVIAGWPAVALLIAVKLLSGILEHRDTARPAPVTNSSGRDSRPGLDPAALSGSGADTTNHLAAAQVSRTVPALPRTLPASGPPDWLMASMTCPPAPAPCGTDCGPTAVRSRAMPGRRPARRRPPCRHRPSHPAPDRPPRHPARHREAVHPSLRQLAAGAGNPLPGFRTTGPPTASSPRLWRDRGRPAPPPQPPRTRKERSG